MTPGWLAAVERLRRDYRAAQAGAPTPVHHRPAVTGRCGSLGQVAFEAHQAAFGGHSSWQRMKVRGRAAWEAAAAAVLNHREAP